MYIVSASSVKKYNYFGIKYAKWNISDVHCVPFSCWPLFNNSACLRPFQIIFIIFDRQVLLILFCYVTSVFLMWENTNRDWLNRFSVPVWLLGGAGVSSLVLPVTLVQPGFAFFCVLLLLGLIFEVVEYQKLQLEGKAHFLKAFYYRWKYCAGISKWPQVKKNIDIQLIFYVCINFSCTYI